MTIAQPGALRTVHELRITVCSTSSALTQVPKMDADSPVPTELLLVTPQLAKEKQPQTHRVRNTAGFLLSTI